MSFSDIIVTSLWCHLSYYIIMMGNNLLIKLSLSSLVICWDILVNGFFRPYFCWHLTSSEKVNQPFQVIFPLSLVKISPSSLFFLPPLAGEQDNMKELGCIVCIFKKKNGTLISYIQFNIHCIYCSSLCIRRSSMVTQSTGCAQATPCGTWGWVCLCGQSNGIS